MKVEGAIFLPNFQQRNMFCNIPIILKMKNCRHITKIKIENDRNESPLFVFISFGCGELC